MDVVPLLEDRIWEIVLHALSADGRLLKFQKLPRHELVAYIKAFGNSATVDLRKVYDLVQRKERPEVDAWLQAAGHARVYCMLHNLVGCMKCWVESESPNQSIQRRWIIAHS